MLYHVSDVSTYYIIRLTIFKIYLLSWTQSMSDLKPIQVELESKYLIAVGAVGGQSRCSSCGWSGVSFLKEMHWAFFNRCVSLALRSADHCTGSMSGEPVAMATPTCRTFSSGQWSCSSPQLPCQPRWSSSRPADISQPRYLGSTISDPNLN